ncbi:ribonuclease H-like domain-containing protein [Penicillium herquei]|nr:ribonuclease H-like domain-containing protein [Penicillium herquei]
MASIACEMPIHSATTIKLPNGRLVCNRHWLIICPDCEVDLRSNKENEDIDMTELEKGRAKFYDGCDKPPYPGGELKAIWQSGRTAEEREKDSCTVIVRPGPPFGTKLRFGYGEKVPGIYFIRGKNEAPSYLFPDQIVRKTSRHRFVNRYNASEFLIYTSGRWEARAGSTGGCAFAFRFPTKPTGKSGYVSFPMEVEGPVGSRDPADPLRVELRAMIAALRFRDWTEDGFKTLILATDNTIVGSTITGCIPGWQARNWKTNSKKPVVHLDLWQCFLGEIERYHEAGLAIKIWHVPPSSTGGVRTHAYCAMSSDPPQKFGDIIPEGVVRGW